MADTNERKEKLCGCGKIAAVRTSKTPKNPNRKFYSCPKYPSSGYCDLFEWCAATDMSGKEDELYKLIANLQIKVQELEVENNSLVLKLSGELDGSLVIPTSSSSSNNTSTVSLDSKVVAAMERRLSRVEKYLGFYE
ncbi:unnamed protein product [Linum trigynum]|uniref:GRF-type domain-containing protein n=1 Tax=Linum trigynum TaxID=586398 RepID=A0AAV2EF12_9ROSI